MFDFDVPTRYVIENKSGHRIYPTMNTELAARYEASYLNHSFPKSGPYEVFRLDISVIKTHIPSTSDV